MENQVRERPASQWALLVIDMQNDFLDLAGYYGRRVELEKRSDWASLSWNDQRGLLEEGAAPQSSGFRSEQIERATSGILNAVTRARAGKRPIAFVQAAYDREFDIVPPLLANKPERTHNPCRPGSWGQQIIEPINDIIGDDAQTNERIFEKHTYDAFSNPALKDFILETGTSDIVVCGTETEVCVLATAQHAAMGGYRTFVLEDCVWSANAANAAAALSTFRTVYGWTISVGDLP